MSTRGRIRQNPDSPPWIAERLLRLILPRAVRAPLLADIAEAYARPGRLHRRLWYWGQVARACWPPTLIALHLEHPDRERKNMPDPATLLDALRCDLRLALRGFRKRPLWATMIAATLSLGIGANATMFGLLDRLLLQAPAHIADPDRVVLLHAMRRGSPYAQTTQPYVMRTVMAKEVSDFADVAVATPTAVVRRQYYPVGHGITASRAAGALVSGNYFSVLGVHPVTGRFFHFDPTNEETAEPLAVLGYGYWQRQYGGRHDAVGQKIEIGTSRYTIVGVAPKGFTGTEMRDVDVWLPIAAASGLRFEKDAGWSKSGGAQWLLIIARLKPDAVPAHAAAQATAAYRAWLRGVMENPTPERLARVDSTVVVLGSLVPGRSLWNWGLSGSGADVGISTLLSAIAFLVLLIACANVTNLLLVRSLGRRREIAVRLALGVSRRRLIAQLVIEGVLLSLGGVLGALAIAVASSPLVRVWLIGEGAWTGGAVDGRVLSFTIALGLIAGLVTSLVPALQASRPDLSASLKAGAREGIVRRSCTRTGLLVAQAALAIVLVSGAGMFIRSLRNVAALDLGLDVRHVLVAQVNEAAFDFSDEQSLRMFKTFVERARTVPGISATAVTIGLPFSMSWGTDVFVPGRQVPRVEQHPVQYAVTDGYFDVLGIRALLGRTFTAADRVGTAPVAIVNETMARLYWPNQSPVGSCVRVDEDRPPCATIVGVVTDTRRQDLVESPVPQLYRPLDQLSSSTTATSMVSFFGYTLIARTTRDPVGLAEPLRRALQSAGPSMPYANVSTMGDLVGQHTRAWELGARILTVFGALALLLAGIGIFSVVAFTIGQRMHEMGVRTALGAQRTDLVRLTIAHGVSPALAGIAAGVTLALLMARFVEALLFQESPRDAVTLTAASAIVLVCALLASLVPALRAAAVDPTIALRAD